MKKKAEGKNKKYPRFFVPNDNSGYVKCINNKQHIVFFANGGILEFLRLIHLFN